MVNRWWGGGGRVSAMNRAIAAMPNAPVEVDLDGARGLVHSGDVEALSRAQPPTGVRLLPGFDPFTNELPRKVEAAMPVKHHDRVHRTAGWVTPIVVVDGRIAGTWDFGGSTARGVVEVQPWGRWRGGARKELAAEVERIAAFLDRPLQVDLAGTP
jgi:hypothetical protein